MEATIAMREEAKMAEDAAGELGEILARIDERFDRAEEKSEERFARAEEKSDERFARVDERFTQVDERFDQWLERIDERLVRVEEKGAERFAETDRRLGEVNGRLDVVVGQVERTNDRLDSMVRVMIAGNVSLTVGILAGFVSIVALILTQL